MKKLMEEQRKKFGEFEVIDFVDPKQTEALRDQIDIDVPLELHWTWNYGSEVAELRKLYEKGKVNQWNAETDLDWEAPLSKDEWVLAPEASLLAQATQMMGKDEATQKAAAFDEINYLLSQLLHGEQAALQLCGQLTNVCDKMDEKWYASSQVIDEARPHAQDAARHPARSRDRPEEDARHADPVRGHGRRHHGHAAQRQPQRAALAHAPACRAG
jgi:hypothetical protein